MDLLWDPVSSNQTKPNQTKAYKCRLDEEVTVVGIYLYIYF